MDISIYIYIAFFLVISIMAFIIWNLLKKFENQIDTVLELEDENTELRRSIKDSYNKMKEIDSKDIFESDDEVGQTFNALKDVLEKLDGRI
jgi:septation ring formation regulator EzrA